MITLRPDQLAVTEALRCSVEGCAKPRYPRSSLCGMHRKRKQRYGDVNYITPPDVVKERCRVAQQKRMSDAQPHTYKKWYGRHRHRVVAEEKIGRPLKRGEIVHHIDGDRHNNDPSNLEVITQSAHARIHLSEMLAARKKKHGY